MTRYTCDGCGGFSTVTPANIPHTLDCPFMNSAVVRDDIMPCEHCKRVDGHASWCIDAPENNLSKAAEPQPTGAKLEGDHYYRVRIATPMSPEVDPYVAECGDIIEALNMTFNEGELFKAIWRLAKSRQGKGKPGNSVLYDAEKVGHYGARVLAHTKLNLAIGR